jgi:RNA polymerase sigma-70 factor (ECF subfamily)
MLTAQEFTSALEGVGLGDERAFALLWRSYQPPLIRYLRVVAGAAADDLASETWVDVVRSIHRFDGDEAGFRGWLFTIARRRHIDYRRAQRRRPLVSGDDSLADLAGSDDVAEAVDSLLATEDAIRLISSLPPDQAEVVALRAIGGLDVGRVAVIVGKRTGAVRVLSHRGLHRLAEQLKPSGVEV